MALPEGPGAGCRKPEISTVLSLLPSAGTYVSVGGPCNTLLRLDPVGVGVLLQLSQEVRAPSCLLRKQEVLHT